MSESEKESWRSNLIANNTAKVLSLQRGFKKLGVTGYFPQCKSCEIKEPSNRKFSKCGRCKGVDHCSKERQQADWATHKAVYESK
jgi:hypothetical protein